MRLLAHCRQTNRIISRNRVNRLHLILREGTISVENIRSLLEIKRVSLVNRLLLLLLLLQRLGLGTKWKTWRVI